MVREMELLPEVVAEFAVVGEAHVGGVAGRGVSSFVEITLLLESGFASVVPIAGDGLVVLDEAKLRRMTCKQATYITWSDGFGALLGGMLRRLAVVAEHLRESRFGCGTCDE